MSNLSLIRNACPEGDTSLEGEDALPVPLHVDDGPLVGDRDIERLVKAPEMRIPVVAERQNGEAVNPSGCTTS
jgi:hypothetical protein